MNQFQSSNAKRTTGPTSGIETVKVREAGTGSAVVFDVLLDLCVKSLPGFKEHHAWWAKTIFPQQVRPLYVRGGADGLPMTPPGSASVRDRYDLFSDLHVLTTDSSNQAYVPISAYLLSFAENVTCKTLETFLNENKLQLAPVEVFLSTLLTNSVQLSYDSVSYDGHKVTVVEHQLRIPGPIHTTERCVIAAGGKLRDGDGITREALLGARTSPKGLEFFLPYTVSTDTGGWNPGTLFLVQPILCVREASNVATPPPRRI